MKVTKNTYHLKTKANFDFVKYGDEAYKIYAELVERFGEHFNSVSGSKYVIDNNDVLYRFSDHWGNVASCNWTLKNAPEHLFKPWNVWRKEMILAKADLKNIIDTRKKIDYFKFEGRKIETNRKGTYCINIEKTSKEEIISQFELYSEIEIVTNLE